MVEIATIPGMFYSVPKEDDYKGKRITSSRATAAKHRDAFYVNNNWSSGGGLLFFPVKQEGFDYIDLLLDEVAPDIELVMQSYPNIHVMQGCANADNFLVNPNRLSGNYFWFPEVLGMYFDKNIPQEQLKNVFFRLLPPLPGFSDERSLQHTVKAVDVAAAVTRRAYNAPTVKVDFTPDVYAWLGASNQVQQARQVMPQGNGLEVIMARLDQMQGVIMQGQSALMQGQQAMMKQLDNVMAHIPNIEQFLWDLNQSGANGCLSNQLSELNAQVSRMGLTLDHVAQRALSDYVNMELNVKGGMQNNDAYRVNKEFKMMVEVIPKKNARIQTIESSLPIIPDGNLITLNQEVAKNTSKELGWYEVKAHEKGEHLYTVQVKSEIDLENGWYPVESIVEKPFEQGSIIAAAGWKLLKAAFKTFVPKIPGLIEQFRKS